MSKLCGKNYGSGLGDVRRICRRPEGHAGRCSDMPFLMHLEQVKPKVADKIVRDSASSRTRVGDFESFLSQGVR